ncbi:carboxylesterase/lipase family protein [Noviherbaspirillum galbum]|uniref:Carboxylic ester hydrolase n=1 Tax=Noviherbaspirillum galbum TaxID=2709383 RepID=A0A6B3STF9_9BURK|nr:carboxylesterase family protein [Noviherbaspirillum galbum]NEX62126.1 carboxylesterase family protein [Noviherbaspirillum galbum]
MTSKYHAGAACALLFLLQLSGCGGGDSAGVTQRNTPYGTVVGVDESTTKGVYSWKGIPFAKAPAGELRWKAPVDPVAWTTPKATDKFANACAQTGRLFSPGLNNRLDDTVSSTLGQTVGSEDCLYLNVWQPSATSSAPRPVIVFVHGGSNVSGYTADPQYDGAALAKAADAVVVTVNYRVGIFGFLNAASLKTSDPAESSGNFALLDIIKALKFVNASIASFGGDPQNVTLMGHSAGAVNVLALLTSPLARNASPALFQRAIPLSGGIALASSLPAGTSGVLSPNPTSQAQGAALLSNLVIGDGLAADAAGADAYIASRTPAQLADYLRGKSTDAVLNVVRTKLAAAGLSSSNPIPEGTVLPTDPIAAIKAGQYVKVPVLAGNTRDEGTLFAAFLATPSLGGLSGRLIDDKTFFSIVTKNNPEAPPTTSVEQWIPAAYLPVNTPVTGFKARIDVLTQNLFFTQRDSVLNALKSQQSAVWAYQFDWDEMPKPFDAIFGASHAFDLPFVFGNFDNVLFSNVINTSANRPGRLALSDAMMKSISAFARKGDPNNDALKTTWPAWPSKIVFDGTQTSATIAVK